ncbi:tubulin nucleotide-binding domain-like protein [Polychaeton citri CBS 116435]|uniref:Tubulin nucleotide-binding domain-like protein n=1 Tax=Polychaeton citri CBS 116435 TaxID=1314669 RepID=A0A9P4QJX8_9PEZI|nr:tubulin nucleotide-binding domain-like protein [Polychaeton citri CBS 116435]
MHEVITLQFGHRANYLGTHYWNIQESYFTYDGQEESMVDHDISFRQGVGGDGSDTYSPRALLYDLKGAFGTLRRENALYQLQQEDQPHQQTPWIGESIRLQLPPIAPSSYQQALDAGTEPPALTPETVRFWSDYNHIFYHPRSLVQLNEYELNSQLMPFELWSTGEDLFTNLDREHDLLDRDLRPFLEECDQMQAVQIFSSVDDAWGGFTTKYVERMEDELGKGCRWVFGLEDNDKSIPRQRQMMQSANSARSVYTINNSVSAYIPLSSIPRASPPYLRVDSRSLWHVSALQATLVETATLPTRLRSTDTAQANFNDLETVVNNDGKRTVTSAALTIENPEELSDAANQPKDMRATDGYTNGAGHNFENRETLDMDLLPNTATTSRQPRRCNQFFSCTETLRGTWKPEDDILESNVTSRDRIANASIRVTRQQTELLFPMLSSFPTSIFTFSASPQKLAVRASLSTSSAVADRLRSLGELSDRILGVDEREAIADGLNSMAEEYEEGWLDFSDSEDEDE